jgi:hypothetical protein
MLLQLIIRLAQFLLDWRENREIGEKMGEKMETKVAKARRGAIFRIGGRK